MNLDNPFGDLSPQEAEAMADRLRLDMPGCAEWIASRVGDGTVLDYGCGAGGDARLYRPGQYVGIDVAAPLLDEAKRRHPEHDFRPGWSPSEAGLDGASFDHVVFKSVLEHLPSAHAALTVLSHARAMARVSVFVAWHTPPAEKEQIRIVKGVSGRTFHQNTYDRRDFHGVGRIVHFVGPFEMWEVRS